MPRLIAEFTPELLRYYWEVERPSYVKQATEEQRAYWVSLWDGLRPHAEKVCWPIPTGMSIEEV